MRIFIGLVLLSVGFTASAATVSCNNCSIAQKEAAAKATAPGYTYVVDMNNATAAKYYVEKDCEGGRECVKYVTAMSVEPAVTNYVKSVKANTNKQITIGSDTNFPQNAYEAVQYPQLSANVGNYIKASGTGFIQDFINLLTAVNPISGFNPGAISMTIVVNLADGSKVMMVYDHTTQTWTRVKGQTRDTNNNIVPETAADVSGGPGSTITYDFTNHGDNLINFIDRLNMLGVPMTGQYNGRPGIVCVGDLHGGGSTCAQPK